MGKKQIMKVSLKQYGSSSEIYGISLNADNTLLLLENSKLLNVKEQSMSDIYISSGGVGRNGMTLSPHSITASVSATRNVNPQIRTVLENGYEAFLAASKIQDKINMLLSEMEPLKVPVMSISEETRKARGLLTPSEFADAFVKALPSDVRNAMQNASKQNYHGRHDSFRAELYGKTLEISLDVDIDKYFRASSFTYQEYDGNVFLRDNAEKDPQYQKILSQYSVHLPVKAQYQEGLNVGGDKDFLSYYCIYNMKVEKPLTKEYAQKLADDFCKGKEAKRSKGTER